MATSNDALSRITITNHAGVAIWVLFHQLGRVQAQYIYTNMNMYALYNNILDTMHPPWLLLKGSR